MNFKQEQLIVALDVPDESAALKLVECLHPYKVSFKVGLELFLAAGPRFVEKLARKHRVFLDLKFYDIPATVAAAVRQAASLGVFMLNLHASGGPKMLEAARNALSGFKNKPYLIAVTALTSMDDEELFLTGCTHGVEERVLLLARLAAQSGLDGVVCSPLEIKSIKQALNPGFITVTPGVRLEGGLKHDQVRVATPAGVVQAGGDYLVVGRPITKAADPEQAVLTIFNEMGVSHDKR